MVSLFLGVQGVEELLLLGGATFQHLLDGFFLSEKLIEFSFELLDSQLIALIPVAVLNKMSPFLKK